jgi:hypothetical protein
MGDGTKGTALEVTMPTTVSEAETTVSEAETTDTPLSLEALTQRVARTNTLVLAQLHAVQQKRFQDEEARGVRLESKATGLISVNALTLTLVSSVGIGVLLQAGSKLGWSLIVAVPFLVSVWLGLRTGWLALEAVKVRDHHKLSDEDIFPDDVLTDADAVANQEGESKDGEKKDREKDGLALYHRYSIACLSKLLRKDATVNDQKAAHLEHAQTTFKNFIVSVGILGFVSALIAIIRAIAG